METIQLSFFIMLCLGVLRSSLEILQRQKRNWIIDSFTINESYKGPFPYMLDRIKLEKDFSLFRISGQGYDEDPKGILQIDSKTGEITVHGPVDYEKYKIFTLVFMAFGSDHHVPDTQLGVEIQIADGNDNPPKFDNEWYQISIKESTVQGTELITVRATDADYEKNNRLFDFKMVSVTPKPEDLEFYLTQIDGTETGTISFKGCLDHEKAEKYTIIVEAKDRGDEVQLSSSCTITIDIEDGNNHLPKFTGQTGSGRVKEGEENVLVLRLQIRDEDSKGTAAWRGKYRIQGDTNNNFKITTDPETNEGLLYVEKPLDYEDSPLKNLNISVENEIPYQLCKLVSHRTTGLWETDILGVSATGKKTALSTQRVAVTVEDVNEAPVFDVPNREVTLAENVAAGQNLATFTARDPDVKSANTVVYIKGDDPAEWVTLDRVTGKITTTKSVDRESHFVKDNIYNVTIYAVDDGIPPMTGTATLTIHITDENDNAPTLAVSTIDMCQSDGPSQANITAIDLDEDPYGGPFRFKLLGDVGGKWKVSPPHGYSVNLVKEKTVHSGDYELQLEVSDLQHNTAVHALSITVCQCANPASPSCRSRAAKGSTAGVALGIIFFSMLVLAGMLLLAFLVSCKKEKILIPDEGSGQRLMNSNIEKQGTDCEVVFQPLKKPYIQNGKEIQKTFQVPTKTSQQLIKCSVNEASYEQRQRNIFMQQEFERGNSMRWSMGTSSTMRTRHHDGNFTRGSSMRGSKYSVQKGIGVHCEMIHRILTMKLNNLQTPEQEQGDYAPHVYGEEGDREPCFDLDAISNPDIPFKLGLDPDLDFKFSTLASICKPSEGTSYSTTTSGVMGKHHTVAARQVERQQTKISTQSHF